MIWLKPIFVGAVVCGLLWAGAARAQDRVLLLESPAEPRPGLFAALRIQLLDTAPVELRSDLPAGGVAERIRAGTEASQEPGIQLVVWTDGPVRQPNGGQQSVLYAVGRREGRALLQVVEIPGGAGPDMERTLALKVGELVTELQQGADLDRAAVAPEPAAPAPPPAPSSPAEPEPEQEPEGLETPVDDELDRAETGWNARLGLGLLAAPQGGTDYGQWGGAASVGAVLRSQAWRFSAAAGFAYFPAVSAARAGDTITFSEMAPELLLRGQRAIGALWLGLRAGAALSFVDAEGRTRLGAEDEDSAILPAVRAGLDLELGIGGGLALVLALALDFRLVHQRFGVNEAVVADLAAVRPLLQLGLSWDP